MTTNTEKTLQASDLNHFTGSEHWYRHWASPNITYTDGVKYLADKGGAYWLIDEVALENRFSNNKLLGNAEFQVWKLVRDKEGHGANLIVEDGDYNELFRKRIEFTDFPLPEITLWFTDNVILLPSEY